MKTSSILITLVTLVTMATGRTLVRLKRQNYDALLQNKAFVESQLNCVLKRGHCDRIGHRIKILVPEVVQTKECKSCTDDERVNVQKVADHVKIHYPKEWNEIKDQYTPPEEEEELEEEDVIGVSGEDVEEEELTEPQKDAKALVDDDNQEDNADTDNNNNNSNVNNKNNNVDDNSSSKKNNNENDPNSQEIEENIQGSKEIDNQNGDPLQRTEKPKVEVATSTSN